MIIMIFHYRADLQNAFIDGGILNAMTVRSFYSAVVLLLIANLLVNIS